MKAKYICFEGTEGVGKSTQTTKLVEFLRSKGYKVLQTKEPGTPHSPLTMMLRGIMLDLKHDAELTKTARELISQAIRSIHLERVIMPAMSQYDFIVQDRGLLTGYAYGFACGNRITDIENMSSMVVYNSSLSLDVANKESIYDSVIYLKGDVQKALHNAISSKKEFETGDAMEAKGAQFFENVSWYMDILSDNFNAVKIDIDNKTIDEVHNEVLINLGLGI
jgi:dTMP kinase